MIIDTCYQYFTHIIPNIK